MHGHDYPEVNLHRTTVILGVRHRVDLSTQLGAYAGMEGDGLLVTQCGKQFAPWAGPRDIAFHETPHVVRCRRCYV